MSDILIRHVDDETARLLKAKAKAKSKSVSEIALGTLKDGVRPSKEEAWAAFDALRKRIGPVMGDSTKDIREDRDNKERYR